MAGFEIKMDYRPSRDFEPEVRRRAAKGLNACAAMLHSEIVGRISEPTRIHGASLPHNPPHADTGQLRQSLTIEDARPDNLVAIVGSNLDYAAYLEMGTKHMEPRPYLYDTFERMENRLAYEFLRTMRDG